MKRLLSIIAGIGLSLIGLVGVSLSVVAIIDPVGTKMADDTDPFGTPPTTLESSLLLVVCLAITALGGSLTWRSARRGRPAGAAP